MSEVLNIATILICTSITTLVVGMALTFIWYFERRDAAVGWWCLSMWIGTVAAGLLAVRGVAPHWLGLGFGNGLAMVAYGMIWAGFAAFAGKKPPLPIVFAGAIFWLVCYLGSDFIRDDFNNRVIVMSTGIFFYCLMVVRDTLLCWKSERLPSLLAALAFYATHGLIYFARIPLSIFMPVDQTFASGTSAWFAFISLEIFVHNIFSSFVFFALIKERAERRYRLAAEIDHLTTAMSRRHFVAETRRILAKKPQTGVLAVLDLDHFKRINDTYGHMAGDRVLQSFGRYVAGQIEGGMLFGRLGGEEFGLYLPGMSEPQAQEFLDSIRIGAADLPVAFNGHQLRISSSIGAASVREAGIDFDHLMAGADNALYACKHQGRNRVLFFTLSMRMQKIVEAGMESRVSLAKDRVSRVAVRDTAFR